jgi:hypothetical protein
MLSPLVQEKTLIPEQWLRRAGWRFVEEKKLGRNLSGGEAEISRAEFLYSGVM